MNITIAKESEWREAVVKLLLQQKGIHVNTRDDYWNYTLDYAAENGDEAVVRLLLEVGLTLRGRVPENVRHWIVPSVTTMKRSHCC